jgi:2-dehydro-3-deoxygluconokinase
MARDVLAFGEALVRLQAEDDGRIEEASRFFAYPGGAELNTSFALASLGLQVAFFSVLPEGPLGRRVLRHLRGSGVDCSLVKTREGRLGTYWVDYGREPRPIEVYYDRRDSTVCHVQREDVPWEALRAARIFFVSGITPALSPACRDLALEMAETARAAGVRVAVDVNYRHRLWTREDAAPVLERLAQAADIIIATEGDLRFLFGLEGTAEVVAQAACERFHARRLVLTRGGEGGMFIEEGETRRCAVVPSVNRDRIGAGDAFTAGYLYGTLTGREDRALDYGVAMAALKRTVSGDTLTTTPQELESVLAREATDIKR